MEYITIYFENKQYYLPFSTESKVEAIMKTISETFDLIPNTFVLTNKNNILQRDLLIEELESPEIKVHIFCQSQ